MYHFILPVFRKPSSGSEIPELEFDTCSINRINFIRQLISGVVITYWSVFLTAINFIDNGKYRNFKEDSVKPGAFDANAQLPSFDTHFDIVWIELKAFEEAYIVLFEEG